VLFIFASQGQGGEQDLTPRYFAAAGPPKELGEIDGGHTQGLAEQPREYERRVAGFFERALLGPT
jgi:hypothetical protein